MKFRLLFVLLASLAILSGCGNSSDPVNVGPVDYGPPAAPTGLNIDLNESDGSRWLRWSAVASPNLAGYQVYQYNPDPFRETSYEMVAEMGQVQTSYQLPSLPVGSSVAVRVCAFDRAGRTSPMSDVVVVEYEEVRTGDTGDDPSRHYDLP